MALLLAVALPAYADASSDGHEGLVGRDELLRHLVNPDNFVLLDARSEEEYASGHVAGAANLPHDRVDEFESTLPADHDVPLVVYCRTGKRAELLAAELRAAGYQNVRTLHPDQIFWSEGLAVFNCASDTGRAAPF